MGLRIFVSRPLGPHSPIRDAAKDCLLVDQSLIVFSPVSFDPPLTDWVFFYSKNGVRHFFEQGDYALHPYQWAALGPGTAEALERYVTDISFVGSGDPAAVSLQLSEVLHPASSITFIRAQNSRDSVRHLLDLPPSMSTIVYDNQPTDEIPIGTFDILIFTSPMNVKTWLQHHPYTDEHVICIGDTTARAAMSMGIGNIRISERPTEDHLAATLARLISDISTA